MNQANPYENALNIESMACPQSKCWSFLSDIQRNEKGLPRTLPFPSASSQPSRSFDGTADAVHPYFRQKTLYRTLRVNSFLGIFLQFTSSFISQFNLHHYNSHLIYTVFSKYLMALL